MLRLLSKSPFGCLKLGRHLQLCRDITTKSTLCGHCYADIVDLVDANDVAIAWEQSGHGLFHTGKSSWIPTVERRRLQPLLLVLLGGGDVVGSSKRDGDDGHANHNRVKLPLTITAMKQNTMNVMPVVLMMMMMIMMMMMMMLRRTIWSPANGR